MGHCGDRCRGQPAVALEVERPGDSSAKPWAMLLGSKNQMVIDPEFFKQAASLICPLHLCGSYGCTDHPGQ